MDRRRIFAVSCSVLLISCTSPFHHHDSISESIRLQSPQPTQKFIFQLNSRTHFKTLAINSADIAFIKISMIGVDLPQSLTNDGDAFIPIINGEGIAQISNVPINPGKYRVATVKAYDSNQNFLSSFVAKGFYISQANQQSIVVDLNRRQLLLGAILEALISENNPLLSQLNPQGLQSQIDIATGYDEINRTFDVDPTLFSTSQLVQLVKDNAGVVTAAEMLANAQLNVQNVSVELTSSSGNLVKDVEVLIDDPNSSAHHLSSGTVTPMIVNFQVNPGQWNVKVLSVCGEEIASTSIDTTNSSTVSLSVEAPPVQVTTFAGWEMGTADGIGTEAQFENPTGIAIDLTGNLYVTDNHRIRKIDSEGRVITIAGSTQGFSDGVGTEAQFNVVTGIVVDSANTIYVADFSNHRIRKIASDLTVTTWAGSSTAGTSDGMGTEAQFSRKKGLALDSANQLYVVDMNNHKIRKIDSNGQVTTIAGDSVFGDRDGLGTEARFTEPSGVAVDQAGNILVADHTNDILRKINSEGQVVTIAGSRDWGLLDGVGTAAKFKGPFDLSYDNNDNLYITDLANFNIRRMATNLMVTTIAGSGAGFSDGVGTAAKFASPTGIVSDRACHLYVVDQVNYRIRKIKL